jgi:hypothetical protein
MHYVDFDHEGLALQFKVRSERLGWICSTPFQNPNGTWSIITNRP